MYSKEIGNQQRRISVEEGPAYCVQGGLTLVLHLFWVNADSGDLIYCKEAYPSEHDPTMEWAASLGSELSDTGDVKADELFFWECQWETRYSEL